jgi:putative endonuclease
MTTSSAIRGAVAHHGGAAAEGQVAQHYERRGFSIAGRRWRSPAGEVDLIARDGRGLVFVEVKRARSFRYAAERISTRQRQRIQATAECFLAGEPGGLDSEVRFDVALVDGTGAMRIVENAFGQF